MSNNAKSFRDQLMALRPQVQEAEVERITQIKEERERTKDKLAEELRNNPPERLIRQLREIDEEYKRVNKHFYPCPSIQKCIDRLDKFNEQLSRYKHYQRRYPDIYSQSMKRSIDDMIQKLQDLRDHINPQWEQWQKVENLLENLLFRNRKKSDDPHIVEIAKAFHKRAHGIQLDLPKKFFAGKGDNFYVAEAGKNILGYFEFFPSENRLSFTTAVRKGINFIKLVRSSVYKFCQEGPLPKPLAEANVRIYSRQEVKFFTDLGFIRTETLGMSDWLYQKKLF